MYTKLNRAIEWILAILLGVMVLDVLWGVFTRYLLASQSTWTDELARYLMIWVSILGAAYVSGKNQHIAIDLLPNYLNDQNKKRLEVLIAVLILSFVVAVFIVGGLRYVYISFKLGQLSPALKIPLGYVYMIFPIAGLSIIYFKMHDLIKILKT